MYLTRLKALIVEAVKEQFDQDYPEADFRGIRTSIEYPVAEQEVPAIWVDYDDTSPLQIAGVHHREFTQPGPNGARRRYTRWKFAGTVSLTVVAMSSLERDRLYDELIRVVAFDSTTDQVGEFRAYIENNDLIGCNINFDTIAVRGNAAAPGTPWGTDEMMYERSIQLDIIGEFVSEGAGQALVPLREIRVFDRIADITDDHPDDPGATGTFAWQ
jgi:hypothetical protein